MATESNIIPLCLYSNERNSYIGLPEKFGKDEFICSIHPTMKLIAKFYAINPDMNPKPTYSDLFCVQNSGNETIGISLVYDMFNIDHECIRFIAWTDITPCAVPLYITSNGNNLYISLTTSSPDSSYKPYRIPVIYVLFDPRDEKTSVNCKGKFNIINNKPNFTFSNSFNKCIPDPSSNLSVGECMVLYNENIKNIKKLGKYPSLLSYLELKYGSENKPSIDIVIILMLCLVLILIFVIIIVFKNSKMKKYK